MTDLARLEFKRTLEALRGARGGVSALSSFYVPPGTPLHDAVGRIRQEMQWAGMISTPSTRKVVESNLEVMAGILKQYRNVPPHGLCLFVGAIPAASGRIEQHRWILEPPAPVPYLKYYVSNDFFLEPLEAMVDLGETYGLLVMDLGEATLGTLRGGQLELLWSEESLVPNKHGQGGQSSARFERLRDGAIHEWMKKVAGKMQEILPETVKTVLVGGPGMTKDLFVDGYWPYKTRPVAWKTFDVGYTNDKGLSDLVHAAQDFLREAGLLEEQDAVNAFLTHLGRDTGLGAYGKDIVAQAAVYGAVETLLVSDSLSRDTVEDLARAVEGTGGKVKVIGQSTEPGQVLMKAFGGVAAILRYRIW